MKALLVFGIASFTEAMQAAGVPLLGRTFDPLDFAMFGVGVTRAILVDKLVSGRAHFRRPSMGAPNTDATGLSSV